MHKKLFKLTAIAISIGSTPALAQTAPSGSAAFADLVVSLFPVVLIVGLIILAVFLSKRRRKADARSASGAVADRLAKAHELHKSGALTDAEFEKQKAEILGSR